MSETNLFSGNSQTITAVSFVLALLAMVLGLYNQNALQQSAQLLASLDVEMIKATRANVDANNKRFEKLEAEIKAMQDSAAAPATAEGEAAAEGGE